MFIHQYDSQTGFYTNSQLASPDPLDADNWLMPAFSTTITPPERPRGTWPMFKDGAWVLVPDWRSIVLYRCDNGEPAEIFAPGVTPEQVGLTQTPRPSDEHVWVEGAWQIDAQKVMARARAEFQAQLDLRMERAKQANWGKSDALALGILTPLEEGMFKAWAEYQVQLVRIAHNADFTREIAWPNEPDEAEVAKTVAAEQAEKQRVKDEEAARAAEFERLNAEIISQAQADEAAREDRAAARTAQAAGNASAE